LSYSFSPLPGDPLLKLSWPTRNRQLFTNPTAYFARTRANPLYGMPGWTRECGKRFHRGCDIAPAKVIPTGKTCTLMFTDCSTGTEYPSEEPTWIPDDDIFSVYDGNIVEIGTDPQSSDLGCFIVIEHQWPGDGSLFYSLYAHLESIQATIPQTVGCGQLLGRMGQTSRSPMARDFMAAAPHLHLEFWNAQGLSYDPAEMLKRYISPDS